ncbi:MAG: acetate--CoA ligase [Candidatus Desulfofervidaceae bacterium]|nr:acetate--CoA ligase [Candidatus Desulfofervidaceae bacterium]MDL1971545.1 acetate--CoA ligase [Candidatus Desulfofervidaceae bacterium]
MSGDDRQTTEVILGEERVFRPLPETVVEANVSPIEYEEAMRKGQEDFVSFWEEAAKELEWYKPWDKVLDESDAPFYKWFVGAQCNIVHNALDRHVKSFRKNKVAIIWQGEPLKDIKKLTYYELYRRVNKFANVLNSLGVKKGDRVAIYLPNIPEIAIAMLACAKIGAVHTVVYAGFSAAALRERVNDAKAKIIVTSDGLYRNGKIINLKNVVDEAMLECSSVENVIVVKRTGEEIDMSDGRYLWFHELMDAASDECETEVMDAEDMLFILYTSGTTGKPKGVVHVHGGYMVGIHRTLKWVFDLKETDIYWCAADPGWITGHSYIVYGPLIAGATTLMYEGHPLYPKANRMWKIVEDFGVTILYTAPTTIRMLMRYGSAIPKKHNLSSLRLLGTVGEPINPEAWMWYYQNIGQERCPIMDTWWQTETGAFMITPLPVSLLKPGSATRPFPGIHADVVDQKGTPVSEGKGGFLVIKKPWPSMLRTLYRDPERYKQVYWEKIPGNVYCSGDVARKDEDGYFWIQSRADDVINIAGHRIGTAEVESAIVSYKAVAEAACIGVPDPIKGEVAKVFVILKEGHEPSEELDKAIRQHVRKELGPIVIIKSIEFVDSLPKTRSGKIMRRVLKAKEMGVDPGDLTTLAD